MEECLFERPGLFVVYRVVYSVRFINSTMLAVLYKRPLIIAIRPGHNREHNEKHKVYLFKIYL